MAAGDFIGTLAPLYLCVAIGFVWSRMDQPFDLRFIGELVYLVGAPALVLSAIANGRAPLPAVAMMAGAALLSVAVCAALGAALLRLAGGGSRIDLPLLALPLAGAIGLAIARHRYGPAGYALAAGYFAPIAMLAASLGRAASRGSWRLRALAGAPASWAIAAALALAFMLGGGSPPGWIAKTANLLGGMVAPTLMLMIGVSLARTRFAIGTTTFLGFARIALGGAVGLALARMLTFGPLATTVLVLQGTAPVELFWAVSADASDQAPHAAPAAAWSFVFTLLIQPAILLAIG
jgi:hypothetical protein